MAMVDADWSVDRQTGNIRYIGDDHGGASPSYATTIQFHRWLGVLAGSATSSGDDELDITDLIPSSRATDNLITLLGDYNIDDTAQEHLYDGSIVQGSGATEVWYDGIVNYGNSDVQIQIIQNGAVLSDDWWNYAGAGLNADAAQGISHRFMIKTRTAGADIDGRRLIGISRTYGNTYAEFRINGTARGNNVLALVDASDLNNTTAQATVDAITDVHIDWTDSTTTVNGVNAAAQNVLNVVSGAAFSVGEFIMIGGFNQEYKIASISVNALTLNRNLVDATAGAETVYKLNMGFSQIDVDNNSSNEDYYAQWDKGAQTINTFYEFTKNISRDGTDHYHYGISAELFRGITHELNVTTPRTGTFHACEPVSWTGGTGQLLAVNVPATATKLWIQLLTGTAPGTGVTITGTDSSATCTTTGAAVDRVSLLKTPFVGASTGSAIIGSYGLTLQTTDLSKDDKVFDLTNTQITPPNNVTFSVGGLQYASNQDYVLVGPYFGSSDIQGNPLVGLKKWGLNTALTTDNITSVVVDAAIPSYLPATGYIQVKDNAGTWRKLHYSSWTASTFTIDTTNGQEDFAATNADAGNDVTWSQMSLGTALSADNVTSVVMANSIPTDSPADGYFRLQDDDGFYRKLHYTSFATATFTIDNTDGQEDFGAGDPDASIGNNAWLSYLDKAAEVGNGGTESFSYVYGTADRDFVIKVRNGIEGQEIKEYITTGTMTSNGGSSTAIRTSDS